MCTCHTAQHPLGRYQRAPSILSTRDLAITYIISRESRCAPTGVSVTYIYLTLYTRWVSYIYIYSIQRRAPIMWFPHENERRKFGVTVKIYIYKPGCESLSLSLFGELAAAAALTRGAQHTMCVQLVSCVDEPPSPLPHPFGNHAGVHKPRHRAHIN